MFFLAAMNFQAKFFYYVFGAFLLMIFFWQKVWMDTSSLIYMALGLLMAVYNADEGLMSIIRCFAPCCFYLVGVNIVTQSSGDCSDSRKCMVVQSTGYSVLTMISWGSFSHFTINYIYNIGQSIGRNTNDIWTGTSMAATGQIALVALMAGFAVATLLLPAKKWNRWIAVGAIIVVLMYNLVLAVRAVLVIFAVLLVVGIIYLCKEKKCKWLTIGNILKIFGVFILIASIYVLDIGGIQQYIKESTLFERFNKSQGNFLDNSARNNAKLMFISHMWEYPFGGLHLRASYGYAHDLLLDGYDEYGIVGAALLIAVVISGLIKLMKVMRTPSYAPHLKLALLLVNTAVLLEFTIEPILEGMPWLFSCYCLMNGCMSGMNQINDCIIKRGRRYTNENIADQHSLCPGQYRENC